MQKHAEASQTRREVGILLDAPAARRGYANRPGHALQQPDFIKK
jgi:hypothetical protein